MALFEQAGYRVTHDSDDPQGEIVVVNTCGFIADAKEESINTILEFAQAKTEGRIERLYVMGCLSERYLADLEAEIPEVDGWYGKFNYGQLVKDLESLECRVDSLERATALDSGERREEREERSDCSVERGEKRGERATSLPSSGNGNPAGNSKIDSLSTLNPQLSKPSILNPQLSKPSTLNSKLYSPSTLNSTLIRKLTTPPHYAYVKISEGCDRHCAYCTIPLITGRHKSRPMDEILDEVRWLVSQGVKEIQLIAQELTYYGTDLYGQQRIAELVERMADVEGVEWIRLHYAYPTHFPWDLLRVMREKPNVCNYLDIALQHISDHMLERMQRHVTRQQTIELIERMRREVPGIHLRTTLMVGFPGETDEDFRELLDFVRWARFERMGAFAYSEEEGTYSAEHFEDDVPEEVKQRRLDKLMRVQQHISAEIEAAKIGQVLRVVIDRREGDYFVGRSEFCSPEVDPEVLIPVEDEGGNSSTPVIGQFCDVTITDAEEFDLYGEIIK